MRVRGSRGDAPRGQAISWRRIQKPEPAEGPGETRFDLVAVTRRGKRISAVKDLVLYQFPAHGAAPPFQSSQRRKRSSGSRLSPPANLAPYLRSLFAQAVYLTSCVDTRTSATRKHGQTSKAQGRCQEICELFPGSNAAQQTSGKDTRARASSMRLLRNGRQPANFQKESKRDSFPAVNYSPRPGALVLMPSPHWGQSPRLDRPTS